MNFILNLIGILFESISVSFIINVTIRVITKEESNKNLLKIFYTIPFLFIVFIINSIITFYMPSLIWLKVFIFIGTTPFIFVYIYKTNILKGFLTISVYLALSALTNILVAIVATSLGIEAETLISNQTYRAFTLIIIAGLELFVGIISYTVLDVLKKKFSLRVSATRYIIPQVIAIFTCMLPTMIILMLNFFKYSVLFITINFIQLLVISTISLYNSRIAIKQDCTEIALANTIKHNKTLIKVNEDVRGFKHDMSNIVQSLLGYVALNDLKGIKDYCKDLVIGFGDINVLSILTPDVINDPAIYGVVVNKMFIAREKNMVINIDVASNLEDIDFPRFELARVLGILLDNAIETSESTADKQVGFRVYKDYNNCSDNITITNSIEDTKIDIMKMFCKEYSTKANHSGIGLYTLKQILKRHNNTCIVSAINEEDMLFSQTIIIKSI